MIKKDFPEQQWNKANIGVLEIWKSPIPWLASLRGELAPNPPELRKVNSSNGHLAIGSIPKSPSIEQSPVEERAWLSLYAEMVLWGVRWPYDQPISHDLEPMIYHFHSSLAPNLRLSLRITPEAVAPGEARIKWIELVNGMMYILRDIVAAEDWQTFTDKWSSYDYVIFCYISMQDISGIVNTS